MSYLEKTTETTIFFPKSTWTSGRNKIREHVISLEKQYDYYVFLDEDVVFDKMSQKEGFSKFEELINDCSPYIANPIVDEYYNTTTYDNNVELGLVQTTIWYDGMCNAFSKDAFFSNDIFPYNETFDKVNWWGSQYIMIMLCSLYEKEVVIFNNLRVNNIQHTPYPSASTFIEIDAYMLELLKSEFENMKDMTIKEFVSYWDKKEFICIIPDDESTISTTEPTSISIKSIPEPITMKKLLIQENVIDNQSINYSSMSNPFFINNMNKINMNIEKNELTKQNSFYDAPSIPSINYNSKSSINADLVKGLILDKVNSTTISNNNYKILGVQSSRKPSNDISNIPTLAKPKTFFMSMSKR